MADPNLWASRVHPDDRDTVFRIENRDRRRSTGEVSVTEYRLIHRDGREIWVRDEARLSKLGRRRFVWRGTLSDITEARMAEQAMAEAYERQIQGLLGAIQDHVDLIDNRLDTFSHGVRDFPRRPGRAALRSARDHD